MKPNLKMRFAINNKGFSLIELLIAVAVLGVGITTMLQAMGYSARVTGLSGDIVQVLFLTEDKAQELEFKERKGKLTQMEDSSKEGKFAWSYLLVPDNVLNLYKLDFKASWQRMDRNEELNLLSYLKI